MMLFCVSAVSAEDNLNADLGASDASDNAVDLSSDNLKGSEAQTTLGAGSSSVTNDTFFNYFDENGVINKSGSYDELKFDGEFSGLGINTITIDTPITISGANATFSDIGFKVVSEDVTLTGFTITKTTDGAAIDVKADDVIIDGVTVDVNAKGINDTFAIRAVESNNLQLLDNLIAFNAGNTSSNALLHAIDIRDSNNVKVKKNDIDAELPALTAVWTAYGIDQDHPLAVGIQGCENVTFTENDVFATVKEGNYYDTLDTMMVYGVTNIEITDNSFTETANTTDGLVLCLYAVDLYSTNAATISGNDILVNTTSGVDGAGAAYDIQVTGFANDLVISDNELTAISKGPTLGIYAADWGGQIYSTISGNVIDVTGVAANSDYSLVSGMELQDTVSTIVGNEIAVKITNAYNDSNKVYGISYSQMSYSAYNHTFNVTYNDVVVDGKYAVYMGNVVNTTVTNNDLYAHDLKGDDAVFVSGESNVVENNAPPFEANIVIDSPAVWTGNNGNISVIVLGSNGTVTIKIGNKTYENLTLVNERVSQVVDAADLAVGANPIEVVYSGDADTKPATANGNLQVLDGVITADNFKYYFDEDNGNYLVDAVPEGATLDFQGAFINNTYNVYINKPVNVISSTKDAVFEYTGNTNNKENCIKFNVVAGGNHTNITDISIINGDLFVIGASYVTIDDIYMKANKSTVGGSTGYISIHSNALYTTVKNSYFENGGTGSSILVLGKGGKYAVFDNNVFNVTGSSGNILSANQFVSGSVGEFPECVNYTNNIIYNSMPAAATMVAITVCGENNLIENNTIFNFKGSGVANQWGATSTKNVYRNNNITGGGSISAGTYSIIENNYLEGTLTVTEGCNATGNTAKTLSISGKETIVDNNTINGAVTIAAAAANTTFTNNYAKDALTVSSNDNIITDNQISTEKDYAIDLKSTSGNTVKYNVLSSKDKMGDDAVKYAEGKDNVVKNNGMNAIIEIEVANSWSGDNNAINITVVNATGTVTVKVNDKEFDPVTLDDSKATFVIPAADIEVGLNDLTVSYSGNKVISPESKTVTFYGLDNVVFTEVFFDFFDENGILKKDVPYDDLIFKGAFAKSTTVQYIIIDRPVSISSEDASLSLMGIAIGADNVTIDGLKLTATVNSATSALGDLITVNANNVTLCNLDITYKVTRGDYDAVAIDVFDADNVNILNNKIVFSSVISSDDYFAKAINMERVSNALVDNNTITTTLPGLLAQMDNYDWDYFMMGLNTVNPVKMKEVVNSTFSNNVIDSSVNNLGKTTPTIQCLMVVGSENVLFDSNTFRMIDTKSKAGSPTYLYAFNFGYDTNITVSNNDFFMSTTGGQDSAGAAYALQGVESEIYVIGNNITTVSNGPNLGFYVASMMGGSSESYIANNFFNVTGNATTSQQWALISGIEITNGNAYIYNNTIFTYNKAGYVEIAPVHGVSYGQYMYGERSLDVQNNTMVVQGKYTVSVLDGTPCNVTYNTLYAKELFGDESVAPGYDGIVENNTPPFDAEIIIDAQAVWIGSNSTVTVTVPAATGNVTIVIGNKTYKELKLDENGTVTVDVDAADLVAGSNNVTAIYNGDLYIKAGETVGNLEVLYGVITNETFKYYFDADNDNYLFDYVPADTTLDFQGAFIGGDFSLYINKPENVVSTTGDAVFDSGANPNYNWVKFNVVAGANHTNITGISIINGDLFIQGASYVTVDDIYMKANMRGVGSGTGFISVHSEAYYTTVKNSYFENGGTGSSCLVLGKGGKYASFDNNYFNITGSSGNVLSSNVFVGKGELPQCVNYTNNVIDSHVAASGFMYGITVCGEGNIIENNSLLNFKGNAIINQYGATSTKNIYRNNTITGGGSMQIGTYSLVENNKVGEGALTVTEGCTFINNTAKSLTISGKNVVATDNMVLTTVTISAAAKNTTFVDNDVFGLVTVNSDENTIVDNVIISVSEYAVDLKSSANNTVTDNILYGIDLVGDKAVNFLEDKDNTVKDNFPIDPVLVVVADDIKVGENATIYVLFAENVTDIVEVIVDGKRYNVEVFDGEGQLIVSNLAANDYTVGATYYGDILYIPTENSTKFTVEKEISQPSINISEIKLGESADVTVDIPGATGNVSVIVDGIETIMPLDENGTAVYTIPAMTPGDHSVVVIYTGDDTHAATYKATQVSLKVMPTQFTNITVFGDLNITAVLADEEGNPIANAVIDYIVGSAANSTVTGADGSFIVAGENGAIMKISFAGNDALLATEMNVVLSGVAPVVPPVSKIESRFNITGNSITIKGYAIDKKAGETGMTYATELLDINGNPISNVTIQFAINDKIHSRVTYENGSFEPYVLNMLRAGRYTLAFSFGGNDQYNSTFAVVCIDLDKKPITIKASAKTYKASAKTKKYTATLSTIAGSSADGKVHLRTGLKVTMDINGKSYTGSTNSKGQVSFNLQLTKKGTYNAKISYAGDQTYNSASKTVKITIN